MSRSRRVTSMSPGEFTATVGPLDLPDPKLDLPLTSVYIHHFLTLPQPCFPTSSTDLGFSCWQTLENQWKSCHVFKGKIHSGNNYAKYSGIVTTREMLTLIIPKGQQPSSTGTEANGRKVASGHPIQSPSISSRCIAEWWFVTPTLLASCAAENDRTPSVFDAFANIVVLEKVLSRPLEKCGRWHVNPFPGLFRSSSEEQLWRSQSPSSTRTIETLPGVYASKTGVTQNHRNCWLTKIPSPDWSVITKPWGLSEALPCGELLENMRCSNNRSTLWASSTCTTRGTVWVK